MHYFAQKFPKGLDNIDSCNIMEDVVSCLLYLYWEHAPSVTRQTESLALFFFLPFTSMKLQ